MYENEKLLLKGLPVILMAGGGKLVTESCQEDAFICLMASLVKSFREVGKNANAVAGY